MRHLKAKFAEFEKTHGPIPKAAIIGPAIFAAFFIAVLVAK